MYPRAPQLWERQVNGTVGVSLDPPGETYWKIANGIRLTGMPAFGKLLNSTQIWQVTLLVSRANRPLPPGAVHLLRGPATLTPSQRRAAKHTLNAVQLEPVPVQAPSED
jgi:hypothetical protein